MYSVLSYYFLLIINNIKYFYNDLDERSRRCLYLILFVYLNLLGLHFFPRIYGLGKKYDFKKLK